MFEEDIHRYDLLAKEYVRQVVEPMGKAGFQKYSQIMLSCHSCGIEGSSFSVDDTRALFEEGLGYRPVGKSLLECQEMADHFAAYEWMHSQLDHAFDVELVPFFFKAAMEQMRDELEQKRQRGRDLFFF